LAAWAASSSSESTLSRPTALSLCRIPLRLLCLLRAQCLKIMLVNYGLLAMGKFLSPDEIIIADNIRPAYVTYPVRCTTVIEILGLLCWLFANVRGEYLMAKRIADYLSKFVEANLGCTHPISDRWGVSLVSPTLALF